MHKLKPNHPGEADFFTKLEGKKGQRDLKSTKTTAAYVIFVHEVFGPQMPAGGVIHSNVAKCTEN